METRVKAHPEILGQRRELVEHPFGSIKQWMNQGAFLTRGLEKVRAEFSLTALAYNMTRVLKFVGIERLLKGVQKCQRSEPFRLCIHSLPSLPENFALFPRTKRPQYSYILIYCYWYSVAIEFSHGLGSFAQRRRLPRNLLCCSFRQFYGSQKLLLFTPLILRLT